MYVKHFVVVVVIVVVCRGYPDNVLKEHRSLLDEPKSSFLISWKLL